MPLHTVNGRDGEPCQAEHLAAADRLRFFARFERLAWAAGNWYSHVRWITIEPTGMGIGSSTCATEGNS
jgi:hypothetical protein